MKQLELSGKVAIVTGGDSGIGKAISELFAAEGASVVIVDIADGTVADSISKGGGIAWHVKADVRSDQDAGRIVEAAVSKFGGVDVLCNNAGIELMKPMIETTEDEWDRVLDTNLKGVFLLSKHVIPEMIKRGGGSIVNTASQLGLVGLESFSAYCASKGGVILLTKAMALEHTRHNIRVNCVCPGPVETSMLERELMAQPNPDEAAKIWAERLPIRRFGTPGEVAQAVLFLASGRSSFSVGQILVVDGGYTIR
ncbi:MAG: glucose 1-dehydrogenase [Thaumarchaeota archaeon]|nr:glucose 1-dehydrogenase [Nitrososphaerota archaeon]